MPVNHVFSCLIPDDPVDAAAGKVLPSHWNSSHSVTLASNEVIKSISAGGASVSSGMVVFADSNGVSFGMNAGTITATVQPGAAAGIAAASAGTQQATSGTVVFANSNGISFGMSGSSQITASYTVPSTVGLISAVNFSAGTTSQNLGSVVFSNSNAFSFGLNGSTITGSYTVPSTAGLISAINVSAGTTSNNASAIVLSNSNNVSFGLNGSTITGTATFAQSNQSAIKAFGASNTGNTAGNTGVSSGIDWILAGTNNITVSESTAGGGPNTLWLSGGPVPNTLSNYGIPFAITHPVGIQTNSIATVMPITLPVPVVASDLFFVFSVSVSSAANNSSAFLDQSLSVVLYTLNGSTLSSLNSGSATNSGSWSSNSRSSVMSAKAFKVVLASVSTFAPGTYWIAFHCSTTNTGTGANTTALGNTISVAAAAIGVAALYSAVSFGEAAISTRNVFSGMGTLTRTDTVATIAISDISQSGGHALWFQLRNTSLW